MKSTVEFQHSHLLKRFHTLCTKAQISVDEKYTIVGSYGHESSRDMTNSELVSACSFLENQIYPDIEKMDHCRKRVLASIGGWLRLTGRGNNTEMAKAIAVRASGYAKFNDIPMGSLVSLYNAFLKKQKDWNKVGKVVNEDLEKLTHLN